MAQSELQKVMEYQNTLPEGFNGVFYFTNDTNEDFVGKWSSREYVFPAHTTSPMIMPQFTPLEVQQIRKKFARDLAEREFFKGKDYKKLESQEHNAVGEPVLRTFHAAGTYSESELVNFIQQCLKPLPVVSATVREGKKVDTESKLSRDEDGELNTVAIKNDADLVNVAQRKGNRLKEKAGI